MKKIKKTSIKRISKIKKYKKLKFYYKCLFLHPFTNEKKIFTNIYDKQIPFKIKFQNQESPFFKKGINFKKFISSYLKLKKRKIEINCSQSILFSGHFLKQKIVEMTLKEFDEYEGDLNLYMAQIPIFKKIYLSDFLKVNKNKLSLLSNINKKNFELLGYLFIIFLIK